MLCLRRACWLSVFCQPVASFCGATCVFVVAFQLLLLFDSCLSFACVCVLLGVCFLCAVCLPPGSLLLSCWLLVVCVVSLCAFHRFGVRCVVVGAFR